MYQTDPLHPVPSHCSGKTSHGTPKCLKIRVAFRVSPLQNNEKNTGVIRKKLMNVDDECE